MPVLRAGPTLVTWSTWSKLYDSEMEADLADWRSGPLQANQERSAGLTLLEGSCKELAASAPAQAVA